MDFFFFYIANAGLSLSCDCWPFQGGTSDLFPLGCFMSVGCLICCMSVIEDLTRVVI